MRDEDQLKEELASAGLKWEAVHGGIKMHNPNGATHQTPNRIIVHAMGEYILDEHAPDFLISQGLSAHVLAAPDGTLIRCRADEEGAYHALGFNTDSLGIEMLVAGHHDYGSFLKAIEAPWVTDAQYAAVVKQCREWMQKFSITRIERHCDVSPGRKLDPGTGFPWDKFLTELLIAAN